MKQTNAGVLNVAFDDQGPAHGNAVILLHGFPYDVRAYDDVIPLLVAQGCRVVTPYLRGYGPTRFLSNDTPRSGQQAVLAHDLLALMDALAIPSAVLAGYDWGGRAACIVAALWPERARGLVSGGGYNVHDVPGSSQPAAPEDEHRMWYQYYFHSERGRIGLERNRHALCKLLWKLWSPNWNFNDATYDRTAVSFENPDFVAVVIHSYRVRFGLVRSDPTVEATEQKLIARPKISVPTIALDGGSDGVARADGSARHRHHFDGPFAQRTIGRVGHNLPQEAPKEFAGAILELASATFRGDTL
jgi:pimeloyl-ACP methyl ester carboxylesterase